VQRCYPIETICYGSLTTADNSNRSFVKIANKDNHTCKPYDKDWKKCLVTILSGTVEQNLILS
jgi:hypothetical protein